MNEIARSGTIWANTVNAFGSLHFHWLEYLMEAGELAHSHRSAQLTRRSEEVRKVLANGSGVRLSY